MNIDDIIRTNDELAHELRIALATMERSDKVAEIRKKIIDNQKHCPHTSSKYNWTIANGVCPYCGFAFDRGREY